MEHVDEFQQMYQVEDVPMEELPEHVYKFTSSVTGATVYIIGTAHVSETSTADVEKV